MSGVTLEALRRRMAEFAKERDWDQFHSPRNLLLALVITFLFVKSLYLFAASSDGSCLASFMAFFWLGIHVLEIQHLLLSHMEIN